MTDPFGSEIFAVLAAACFGAGHVALRRGLVETTVVAGVLVGLVMAAAVIGVVVAFDSPHRFDLTGAVLFGVAGLTAQGIAAWTTTAGVRKLGPSIAAPITQSTRVLLAVAGALLFLNESLTLQRVIGLVAIIVGGSVLSRSKSNDELNGSELSRTTRDRHVLRPGIVYPLLAGTSYAASDVVVKDALSHMPDSQLGALIGVGAALIASTLVAFGVPSIRRGVRVGNDLPWAMLSGLLWGVALLSLFAAFDTGDVSVVTPVMGTQPLFVFVFSMMLLRRLERLRVWTILAGVGVVVGTVIISL